MRKGKSSRTAEFVSAWRGLAGLGRESFAPDPIAKHLVSAPVRVLLEGAERAPRAARFANALLNAMSGGVWRHLPLRTRAIDDAVLEEVDKGTRQVVLLGAGLDARGHRLEALEECTLFEIDHPDTQKLKMQNARNLPQIARQICYVPVDFEQDDLGDALAAAHFDSTAPACFIWEGVTMYLPRPAIEATLSLLARIACVGSCLAVTYYDSAAAARTRWARPFFSLLGEPLHASFARAEIRELFAQYSFSIESDEGDEEWGDRFVGKRPLLDMSERLVIARR